MKGKEANKVANDDMKRVGIVFKADGTVNFQKSLKEVNQAVNENRSAFRLAQSEWDESTSTLQKLRDRQEYLTNQTEAYSEKVRRLTEILETLENAEDRNEEAISRTREQLNNAQATLNNYQNGLEEVNEQLSSGSAQLEEYASKIEKVGEKATSIGTTLTKGLTVPIAAVGTAAGAAWNEIDEAYDNIAAGTGAVGDSLQELQDSFDNVYGNFQSDSDATATAIADINTRFGFTEKELENCTTKFLKFSEVNNTDVGNAVQKVSRYMGDANIEASEYGSVLDALTAASQASGITVDTLAENLTKYGASLRALGLSTQESVALFSQWEKAGVNTEIAFSGMKKAISTWAKEGKDSGEEFKKMLKEIEAAPDIASATTTAIEVFGTKAGPDLEDAIQNGRFSVEEFLAVVQGSAGQLDASFEAMQDGPDEAKIAMNNLKLAGADLADTALTSLAPAITSAVEGVKEFTSWFKNLDSGTKEIIVRIALLVAAIGPAIIVIGKIISGVGSIVGMITKLMPLLSTLKSGIATVNAVLAANPIILVIAAIVALIAIIVTLYTKCEWFRDGVNQIGEWLKNFFTKEIPEAANSVIEFIKTNWQGILLFLINPFVGGFKLLYDNCAEFKEYIDDFVEKIKEGFEKMAKPFKDAIQSMKDAWSDLKDSIKLPHFDISGSFSISPPKTPKLSVEWYAKGAILNRPTIFGRNGRNLIGGGEAGPEAVLPISNLLDYMRTSNAESNAELLQGLMQLLPTTMIQALKEAPMEVKIYLGNKKLGKEFTDIVIKNISRENLEKKVVKGATG